MTYYITAKDNEGNAIGAYKTNGAAAARHVAKMLADRKSIDKKSIEAYKVDKNERRCYLFLADITGVINYEV